MAIFKVYHGKPKPLVAIGCNQVSMLQFLAKFPGWHSVGKSRADKQATQGLLTRQSIKQNAFGQVSINYGGVR